MTREYDMGKMVRYFRDKKGLSQSAVVKRLVEHNIKISRETLSKIETNNRTISAIELKALADVLNIEIVDFFPEEEMNDIVTFFRKRNFSEETLMEISKLQYIVKKIIRNEKIFKEYGNL